MITKMLIAETLFEFRSSEIIHWREEELQFFYKGELFQQKIIVKIQFVSDLPEISMQEKYHAEGFKAGKDEYDNEVRVYTASFCKGKPIYAVSVLKDSVINVFFKEDKLLWKNPNIRILNLIHLEQILLRVNALVLHCSYLAHNKRAILFSAPSGTGKTTQAKLWEKLSTAQIINGDKAIIQKKDGGWFACGYPFHGSSDECINKQCPIDTIVIVRQNSTNYIEELQPIKKLQAIYSEVTVSSWDSNIVNHALNLIMELILDINIICYQCTVEDKAFSVLHDYLEGE